MPVAQLRVNDGVIAVQSEPSRTVTYGSLVGGKRFNLTLSGSKAARKHPSEWAVLGTSVPRVELPAW